jgi:hypothetical protein
MRVMAPRSSPRGLVADENMLNMQFSEDHVRCLWVVLRYGEMHGAPLPDSTRWLLKSITRERRERAREVLLCFHGATRLSRGGGEHARLWGLMGDVPVDVVYIILLSAELEIEETLKPEGR